MTEFKRLSDVEVVAEPSETANVLIEENGIIKKAPKTAVGGGGEGGGYFITFDGDDGKQTVVASTENLYKKIQEMYDNYIISNINIYKLSNKQIDVYPSQRINKYEGENVDERFCVDGGTWLAQVYPDESIRIEYYD